MRNKAGVICMTFGSVLVLAALSLFIWNQNEAKTAGDASAQLMPQILEQIEKRTHETETADSADDALTVTENASAIADSVDDSIFSYVGTSTGSESMTEVEIDGNNYIGYLLFPTLNLEVPVIADCTDTLLKTAPCRYSGSATTDDLVIAGHNYDGHFGQLPSLANGDKVYLVNMDGDAIEYEVVATDILDGTDIEEMTSGEYDMSLFTCDYSGRDRITLRCDRAE